MPVRSFNNDDPFVDVTAGRSNPADYLLESFDQRLLHTAFIRRRSTFIPREILLFLDENYSHESRFGPENHRKILLQIVQLLHEVNDFIK